jgi:hypothetical protein
VTREGDPAVTASRKAAQPSAPDGGRPASPPPPDAGRGARAGSLAAPGAADTLRPARERWLVRRVFPILATVGLIAIAIGSTTWWGPLITGARGWPLPLDLWGTMAAAQRLAHLDLGGLYTQPTGLVSFPGAAVILVPVVVLMDAAGISVHVPGHDAHPAAWLVAGPYEIAISAVALFAADAIAEHLGASRPKRAVLAAASATAVWSVAVNWGHPEDAVAVGLLMYAILALSQARAGRSAWLLGAGVAVQPLVLIALPIVLAALAPRRLAGFLARAATPSVVLLGAAAAANWTATIHAVTNQPNWPTVDHPTPWVYLAPRMGHGAVAAGPGRALAIVVACGCAIVVARRWGAARHGGPWSRATVEDVLWWTAVALALRSVFESVMVAYYLWPVLAVALAASVRSWPRLAATSVAATIVTFGSQVPWHGPWSWWTAMIAGLALTLFCARLPPRLSPRLPRRLRPSRSA